MHPFTKLPLAALAAALLMAVAVSSASARAFSVNEQRFNIRWSALAWNAPAGTATCPVTLRGSFHNRTITKTADLLVGAIYGATVNNAACTGGSATILTGALPWHLKYVAFAGTLPTITQIRLALVNMSLQENIGGIVCLFRTDSDEPALMEANVGASGEIRTIDMDPTAEIDLEDDRFLCSMAGDSTFSGRAAVDGEAVEPVTVRLIEGPRQAELRASPSSVAVEQLEETDRFTVTNSGTGTATITNTSDESADEFDVSSPGCGSTIAAGASCVYTVVVNERPLASGRVTITYNDGVISGRRLSIEVDIAGVDPDLRATPEAVTIGARDHNGIVAVRNVGASAVTITEVAVTAEDAENPEFEATSPGCRATLGPEETCNYVITASDRPEEDGRLTIEYRYGSTDAALVINVDIAGNDNEANLTATPTNVAIERLEANDSFVLKNEGTGTATATILRTTIEAEDRERPEFSVSELGCSPIFIDGASCTYIVSVNSRPEADGRIVFEYEDGFERTRRTTVEVDIAS